MVFQLNKTTQKTINYVIHFSRQATKWLQFRQRSEGVMKGGTNMTQNQIAYANYKEGARHNVVAEKETNRSNLERERNNREITRETARHNVASEGLQRLANMNDMFIRTNANSINAAHLQRSDAEVTRHNRAMESLSRTQAATQARNVEYTYDLGIRNVGLGSTQAQAQLLNAQAALRNADTNRMNAQTNAGNLVINQMNATTNQSRAHTQNYIDMMMSGANLTNVQERTNLLRQQQASEIINRNANVVNAASNLLKSGASMISAARGGRRSYVK